MEGFIIFCGIVLVSWILYLFFYLVIKCQLLKQSNRRIIHLNDRILNMNDKLLEEVASLKIQNQYAFKLTEKQYEKLAEWDKRNLVKSDVIGGGLTFCFTLTGIGTVIKVKRDDDEIDLTDYESW